VLASDVGFETLRYIVTDQRVDLERQGDFLNVSYSIMAIPGQRALGGGGRAIIQQFALPRGSGGASGRRRGDDPFCGCRMILRDALMQRHNEIWLGLPLRQMASGCFRRKNTLPENFSTTSPNGKLYR
jgi:hypothetical protein